MLSEAALIQHCHARPKFPRQTWVFGSGLGLLDAPEKDIYHPDFNDISGGAESDGLGRFLWPAHWQTVDGLYSGNGEIALSNVETIMGSHLLPFRHSRSEGYEWAKVGSGPGFRGIRGMLSHLTN